VEVDKGEVKKLHKYILECTVATLVPSSKVRKVLRD